MDYKSARQKFDNKENVIIVSSYPGRGFSNVSGVAIYTFHMLKELKSILGLNSRKVLLFSDILSEAEEGFEEKDGMLLNRCWKRKSPFVFNQLVKSIKRFSRTERILFHFEFNMYANIFVAGLLPLYLFFLTRIKKKNITLLLHQVVENINELSGHLDMKPGSLKSLVLGTLLRTYYKALLFSVTKTIVHDEVLKARLSKITARPVFVISHGLGEHGQVCDREDARKKLDILDKEFVVLCFGFLAWYKGSDWVADQFIDYYKTSEDATVKLILAGGRSPTLKGKSHYDKYYEDLKKRVEEYPNIEITGFVPEDQVHLYYCASDMVLLPYRTQMSASGPFSKGLAYGRPFLLSKNLEGVLENDDVKDLMGKHSLSKTDLTFELNQEDLFKKIAMLVNDKDKVKELAAFSVALSVERDWNRVVKQFLMVIDA